MTSDKFRLISRAIIFFIPFAGKLLLNRIAASYHYWTYRADPEAKTVLAIGGSFAGLELAKRLGETLPTGYRCVLIERNSHFNHLFNFPRFSVLEGHEYGAFIPYDRIKTNTPDGAFSRIQDSAVDLTETHVVLKSGDKIPYHVLVIATGSSQSLPAKVQSTERNEACSELQSVQNAIRDAQNIAIVGGGAVGVEIVSDIADFYPQKTLTLIHSRGQLMNNFGKRLHDYVVTALQGFKVRMLLNERPSLPGSGLQKNVSLTFSDMHTERFDLVINCTGQRPNSALVHGLYPDSISSSTSRLLVAPTLQLLVPSKDKSTEVSPNVFAFGDVAEHHGPRMARAAFFQAQVVLDNILAVVHGRIPTRPYMPIWEIEGAIKLTLGRDRHVLYTMEESCESAGTAKVNEDGQAQKVKDFLVPGDGGTVDLDIKRAWKMQGVDFELSRKDALKAMPVDSAVNMRDPVPG